MKFTRFEQLVLVIGTVTILGSLALSLINGESPETIEIVAQFMLIGVLACAVFYGRRGGLIAAIVASGAYILMRIPTLIEVPMTPTLAIVMGSRILAFGLLGIVGGEACARIRYSMARLEGGSALDEWSRVFNERFAHKEMSQALGRFRRYGEPFSVVIITLSPSLFLDLKPGRQRALVRGIADHVRGDIRMVDEVARLDDGRFVVLMPHTPAEGGEVVNERLAALIRRVLGARDEAVKCQLLAVPQDETAIDGLISSLSAPEAPHEASAAYTS
jgi:GGDEF domain-containing protein